MCVVVDTILEVEPKNRKVGPPIGDVVQGGRGLDLSCDLIHARHISLVVLLLSGQVESLAIVVVESHCGCHNAEHVGWIQQSDQCCASDSLTWEVPYFHR